VILHLRRQLARFLAEAFGLASSLCWTTPRRKPSTGALYLTSHAACGGALAAAEAGAAAGDATIRNLVAAAGAVPSGADRGDGRNSRPPVPAQPVLCPRGQAPQRGRRCTSCS